MSKIIDDETMENVCLLAKLDLEETEREAVRAEMQKIIDYADKLNELNTEGIEPLAHIFGDRNVFREDVVVNGDNRDAMLFNAPRVKEGHYQVPKTIG